MSLWLVEYENRIKYGIKFLKLGLRVSDLKYNNIQFNRKNQILNNLIQCMLFFNL